MAKSQEIIDFGWSNILEQYKDEETIFVDVGIVAKDSAKKTKKGDLTLAELATIQEFGAMIDHPGGTSFGFKSKASAERNEIRFLKEGKGFIELGKTGPHEIVIPSRPFIRQTFDKNIRELWKLVKNLDDEVIKGKIKRKKALVTIGQVHQNQIQEAMSNPGEFEANAPSTIRKKKSAQPLIDTGRLRQSINFEVG